MVAVTEMLTILKVWRTVRRSVVVSECKDVTNIYQILFIMYVVLQSVLQLALLTSVSANPMQNVVCKLQYNTLCIALYREMYDLPGK